MSKLSEHPSVKKYYATAKQNNNVAQLQTSIDAAWLRGECLEAGADDVGFVDLARTELDDQREMISEAFPWAQTLISIVKRMNPENVRTPARSVSNLEFHHSGDETNDIARNIAARLNRAGYRSANGAAMGFPMEVERWPGRMWIISHKPVAVAAGLGRIGIHRNVIHPRFGNFILLATIVVDASVTKESHTIDYNPCLECKLCVAACPTGAIHPDGHFDFTACYTHNYREFMGGFGDWAESLAESTSAADYRKKFTDAETVSVWQSLSFGANYKAAYCMAVCPAGEEVIQPFLEDRGRFLGDVVRPLQQKVETIYVSPESDAEDYAVKRFPHKNTKRVGNGLRPSTIAGFRNSLAIGFQKRRAANLDATYHFNFRGQENMKFQVRIKNGEIVVSDVKQSKADFILTIESKLWLAFMRKELSFSDLIKLPYTILRGRFSFRGSPRWLLRFAACFPK